jgi:PAS domain S-box-containing protein
MSAGEDERGPLDLGPSDGLLRAIADSAADGLYVVEPNGRILYGNPAALDVLGYDDAAELFGRRSHQLIHYKRPDGSPFPVEECPLLEPQRTGQPVRVWEDWFVRRDGTLVPVAYSSAPIQLDDGPGSVVAFHEISSRLELERAQLARTAAQERSAGLQASRARIAEAADTIERRIERDLHDGSQQQFGAMALRLELVRSLLERDPAAAARELEQAQAQLQDALRELRELTRGIRPPVLAERGLAAALRALAVRTPLDLDLDLEDVGRLPDAVESTLYFVASEALANTAKHSAAASAGITLRRESGAVRLTITDDGQGVVDESRGSGLAGLRDRVETLGGELTVTSGAGGVSVTAWVPTSPDAAAEPANG